MNVDFWILKLSEKVYNQGKNSFFENVEYIKIPSSITYNQIFKLLFLIEHTYDNFYDDGTIIIKKITAKQISHILTYLFGYEIISKEIISKENIVKEYENNRIKNIELAYLTRELATFINMKRNNEESSHYSKQLMFFGLDNINEILDGDKYYYYRLHESNPFIKIAGEKEPLIFRDVNKIKDAITYVLKKVKHPENISVYQQHLKKDVVCLMESLKGKKYYVVMNNGDVINFYNKICYIHILYSNKYRREASKTGIIKYPFYSPVEGSKKLKIEELIFLLNKIYGYKTLDEGEVEKINKGAIKGYYGCIHPAIQVIFSGNLNQSILTWYRNSNIKDYARPNVSRIILERQIELAPDNKKQYYLKKLNEIEENSEPEEIILSAL